VPELFRGTIIFNTLQSGYTPQLTFVESALADFRSIPIPTRLASRPRDGRGLPIPFTVLLMPDGKPDFRITDQVAWSQAVQRKICALCAQPLGRHKAFVGGPLAAKNRLFTDLPMHRDCAEYALQVCPFLAAPNFRYAESLRLPAEGVKVQTSAMVSTERPNKFFLGISLGYSLVRAPNDTILVHAAPWQELVWWKDGVVLVEGG
jgi:hypothetical protein